MLFKKAQPEQSAEKTMELLSVSTAMHAFFFISRWYGWHLQKQRAQLGYISGYGKQQHLLCVTCLDYI